MVKIDMPMPKSCDECWFSYHTSLFSNERVCLLQQGIRMHRVDNGDKAAAWEELDKVSSGQRCKNCPLKGCE